jgi:hypothetical protein
MTWRLAVVATVAASVWVAIAHAKSTPGPGVAPPDWPGPLPWRVSGPVGFTVDAATFPDSAGQSLDLYLRIPPATLRTLLAGGEQGGHARITAELKSGYGGRRQQAEQVLEVAAQDTLGEFGEVVLLRFAAKPGPQKLKVKIEDVKQRPTKLPRMGKSKFATADVSGEFEVPGVKGRRQQSDPEFVWEEQGPAAQGPTPFHRLGKSLIPNPERLYGLFSTDLHVAFSATSPDARPWKWRVRVLDERQDASAVVESTATAASRLGAQARIDVSRLPAGGYDLEVTAWQEGDSKPMQRVARFSIAWRPETWRRSSGEIQELVHFLLEGNEEDRFVQLQPGEQERWMEDFWRRRDPSPETAINEAR